MYVCHTICIVTSSSTHLVLIRFIPAATRVLHKVSVMRRLYHCPSVWKHRSHCFLLVLSVTTGRHFEPTHRFTLSLSEGQELKKKMVAVAFLIAKAFFILKSNKICRRDRVHFQTSCLLQRYSSKELRAMFWGNSFENVNKGSLLQGSQGSSKISINFYNFQLIHSSFPGFVKLFIFKSAIFNIR